MGQQIIKQPDGRLAVFSSVVDAFIILDASPEEILDWRAEEAAKEARRATQRQLDHVLADEPDRSYFQFTLTWQEALEKHREHGGDADLPVAGEGEQS